MIHRLCILLMKILHYSLYFSCQRKMDAAPYTLINVTNKEDMLYYRIKMNAEAATDRKLVTNTLRIGMNSGRNILPMFCSTSCDSVTPPIFK